MSALPPATRRTSISYWVYSPGGDPILTVDKEPEALAYARESEGRTLVCVVLTEARTPIPVRFT
jgi:hypothetical protein